MQVEYTKLNHYLFRPICKFGMKLMARRFDTFGLDNFPRPPFVAISNHMSYFDAMAYGAADIAMDIAPLTARKYKGKLIGNVLDFLITPIYIEQEAPDRSGLRQALDFIKAGLPISVAPEGHRSRTGALLQARDGTAYLLRKAAVPIVPMALTGTEKLASSFRPLVQLTIGRSYHLPEVKKATKEQLKEDTDRMMCSIAALMPESYHGFYSDHPFIEEMKAVVC